MNLPVHKRDIICIGASAGGVEALLKITAQLPVDFPAAIFVVIHVPATPPSMLHEILSSPGKIAVLQAEDGLAIQNARIYIAQSDHHLLLEKGFMRVVHGPKENRFRPAIDPMFRSAATAYGPRAVGIVLTGLLDDGTSGLAAIKDNGGIAIVQDPIDARYPSMPQSALKRVAVDYSVPVSELGALLKEIISQDATSQPTADSSSEHAKFEVDIAKMQGDALEMTKKIATPSPFVCPECHGSLWEVKDTNILRFRCHVGHAYTAATLQQDQKEGIEVKLWSAAASFEENAELLRRMARDGTRTDSLTHEQCQALADKAIENANIIKRIVSEIK